MKDHFHKVNGMIRIESKCADIAGLLRSLSQHGIELISVSHLDHLTIQAWISRRDLQAAQALAARKSATLCVIQKQGIYWQLRNLKSRAILLLGCVLVAALTLWLPGIVLFVEVEGNIQIPTALILEQAENCGIVFGASRRAVRSEKMKNSLLEAVSELQWAGINTYGCRAVISVRERTVPETSEKKPGISSIIAVRDGIIESCTATKGTLQCKEGQAVKSGETLISGYTDCGLKIQATQAEGEIFAQTVRELTTVVPTNYTQKGDCTGTVKKYGLIFGKKRIKFYKDSGISDATCDKMYSVHYLTLPGGFRLPLALTVEQWSIYDDTSVSASAQDVEDDARSYSRAYLIGQMIAGEILTEQATVEQKEMLCVLTGRYICREMIGRVRNEELIQQYGKNNREDR